MRRDTLDHVVNVAVNQTLGRTVLTAGTALLSVLALYLFGGEVLHGFAFTLLVGVITGTYSTVFIAVAIVTLCGRGGGRRAPRPHRRRRSRQPDPDRRRVTPAPREGAGPGCRRDAHSRRAARRRAGAHRVPAGVQFGPSDPRRGRCSAGTRIGSACRSTWPATRARSSPCSAYFRRDVAEMIRAVPRAVTRRWAGPPGRPGRSGCSSAGTLPVAVVGLLAAA